MTRKKIISQSLLLTALSVYSCALYSVVSSDYDRSADFSSYKTFAWLPDKDNSSNALNNQIVRNNIKNYCHRCGGYL